jgi:flagellar hook assembly protein FlgD
VFGIGLYASPDVNGDGAVDFLISSTGNDAGGDGAGRVYLIAGESAAVSVDVVGEATHPFTLLGSRPNPTRHASVIRLQMPQRATVHVAIYDAGGRTVRQFESRDVAAGPHELTWDGRDQTGRPVGSGVYYATVRAMGSSQTTKIVRTR